MIRQAYESLFPAKPWRYTEQISFSAKFSGYNGKIMLRGNHLEVRMSRKWEDVSPEIQKGFIQSLLQRLMGKGEKTLEIDLYHNFMKSAHLGAPKDEQDKDLMESFGRLNDRYFSGMMDPPNLRWGDGLRKLGHYDYGTDTIVITAELRGSQELVDYVMYHEMLHKKHKFKISGVKSLHHSAEFRKDERAYPEAEKLEKELSRWIRARKRGWRLFG